jgi:preprotein translocase subunit YajC
VIYLILIVGLLVAMWVLLIRPQRRKQMEQQDILGNLAVGDEVVTAGGLYGQVEAIEEDEIHLEIAPGTVVRVAKRAIAAVMPDEADEDEDEEYDEEEPEAAADGEPEAQHEDEAAVNDNEGAVNEASSGSSRR